MEQLKDETKMKDKIVHLEFKMSNTPLLGIAIKLDGFKMDLKDERNKEAAECIIKLFGISMYAFTQGEKVDKDLVNKILDTINAL